MRYLATHHVTPQVGSWLPPPWDGLGLRAAFGSPQDAKASGLQPGDSCNGNSGFLVEPTPETP